MTGQPVIVIATTNRGKAREVLAVLGDLPLDLRTLSDFPDITPPEETAETFAGNAALKASYYARATGQWTLADDSGLEVDALNGAPGIYSARFAGAKGDDTANNRKLIEELQSVPPAERTARFRCALALANANRVIATAEGKVEGVMIDEPRGVNGFGYDPHFWVPNLNRTVAEMPSDLKNFISHRGQALRAIRPDLLRLAST